MSLSLDRVISESPELEFSPSGHDADTQASTHGLCPSETSNDLEGGPAKP